jgi:hypothetical protein
MSVNKGVLEKKSNQELEQYLLPESKFVNDAKMHAFEILKSRGREFSNEEIERNNNLINTKTEEKKVIVHPNYKKSAELIYIAGALGIGNLIWKYDTLDSGIKIFAALVSLAFAFGIGYLVSKGYEWIKFVLLILLSLGLLSIIFVIANIANDPIVGIINIVQMILQIWALVLLFKVPKTEVS